MLTIKVLCICMSISVIFCEEVESQNLHSLLKSALTACEMETKIDMGELKTLSVSQPLSHELSCYIDCVMRKFDLVNNDEFSINKANIFLDEFTKHGENSEEIDVKKGIVKLCADETKSEIDSCSLSGAIFQCIGKEFQKAGFIKEGSSHRIYKRSKSESDEESKEDSKERKKSYINFVAFSYYNFLINLLFQSLGFNSEETSTKNV